MPEQTPTCFAPSTALSFYKSRLLLLCPPEFSRSLFRPAILHPCRPNHISPQCSDAFRTTPSNQLTPGSPSTILPIPDCTRNSFYGAFIDLTNRSIDTLSLRDKFGPIFKLDILFRPVVVVASMDLVLLCARDPTFSNRDAFPTVLSQLFNKDFLTFLDGHPLRVARAHYTPAFHTALHPLYFSIVHRSARQLWISLPTPTDLNSALGVHVLRGLLNFTAAASPLPSSIMSLEDISQHFNSFAAGFTSLPFSPQRRRALRSRDYLIDTFCSIAAQCLLTNKTVIEKLKTNRLEDVDIAAVAREGTIDLVTLFIVTYNVPTRGATREDLEHVAYALLDIWFAGTETTQIALITCIKEMGSERQVWDRLRAEQDEVDEMSLNSIDSHMPLLHSYMLECLRLHPPLPLNFRRAEQDVQVERHVIKKDSIVCLDYIAAARDENCFEEAHKLKMDRFVGKPELSKLMSVVFGGKGSRHHCLGGRLAQIVIKTTLATLVRDFDLNIEARTSTKYRTIPETRPMDGLRALRICPRALTRSK